jgi:hypothetical protein
VKERRFGRGDNQRLVTLRTLCACKQEDLPLAPAPFATAVDVQDPEWHAERKVARWPSGTQRRRARIDRVPRVIGLPGHLAQKSSDT